MFHLKRYVIAEDFQRELQGVVSLSRALPPELLCNGDETLLDREGSYLRCDY